MVFKAQFGLFGVILLCCYTKSEDKLSFMNRTTVALAGKSVVHQLKITIPANSNIDHIFCYQNSHQVWTQSINPNINNDPEERSVSANITMHNSSCSGEYYFMYMGEKVYWVVLVRDVGYLPDTDKKSFLIPMLVVIIVLLLLSVTGSVYIFKWYKNQSPSEGDEVKVKRKKRKRNTIAKQEEATSESVYTALEQRTVSVYDVLNVDELRRVSTESQTTQKKAESSPAEEGIFESVYENLG